MRVALAAVATRVSFKIYQKPDSGPLWVKLKWVPTLASLINNVVSGRSEKQMVGTHATAIVATVTDHHPIRDRATIVQFP